MRNKAIIVGLFVILTGVAAVALLTIIRGFPERETIESFEACVQAGYPIMESYPRQCSTWDGQTFVEVIQQVCQSDAGCGGFYCK